jgi:hypothetical protein
MELPVNTNPENEENNLTTENTTTETVDVKELFSCTM